MPFGGQSLSTYFSGKASEGELIRYSLQPQTFAASTCMRSATIETRNTPKKPFFRYPKNKKPAHIQHAPASIPLEQAANHS